tara:strand:- start:1626 stop:1763 length:138 start_codon:yes stop_codon:yes gene_type:complete
MSESRKAEVQLELESDIEEPEEFAKAVDEWKKVQLTLNVEEEEEV